MKINTLKLISGVLLIFLGFCHQAVHLLFEMNPEKPQIVLDMINYKIEVIGTHSLFQFHTGFSLMTGHFLMCLGIILLVLRNIIDDRLTDITFILIILSISVISVIYFHVLAYGVTFLAAVIYIWALFKPRTI